MTSVMNTAQICTWPVGHPELTAASAPKSKLLVILPASMSILLTPPPQKERGRLAARLHQGCTNTAMFSPQPHEKPSQGGIRVGYTALCASVSTREKTHHGLT